MPALPMRHRGFTLIELLVVIAIIAILASIIFPVYSRAREKGREVSCTSNQRQLAMAVMIRTQENDEKYSAATAVWNEVENPELLKCLTKGKTTANAYVYNLFIAGKSLGEIPHSEREIVTADGINHPLAVNGQTTTNILATPSDIEFRHGQGDRFLASFCDGHVASLQEIPPMWIIDIADQAEFDREVLRTSYPVLVYFYTETSTPSTPELPYCLHVNSGLFMGIASKYRLLAKIVKVNGDRFPGLLTRYNVVPHTDTGGYPTFLFFKNGQEQDRMAGYPPDTADWTDTDWQAELSLCRQQIEQKLDALVNGG